MAITRQARPGKVYSFPWHNDECERSQERFDKRTGDKRFFCKTHNQWADEIPVKVAIIFEYGDGVIETMKAERVHLELMKIDEAHTL